MRNFEEKMIQKSRNLKHKRRLPMRVIHRLARYFDKGYFIPWFTNHADNIAIEASCAQRRQKQTDKSKYKRNKLRHTKDKGE